MYRIQSHAATIALALVATVQTVIACGGADNCIKAFAGVTIGCDQCITRHDDGDGWKIGHIKLNSIGSASGCRSGSKSGASWSFRGSVSASSWGDLLVSVDGSHWVTTIGPAPLGTMIFISCKA